MNRLKLGLSVAGLACAGVALAAIAQPAPPPAADAPGGDHVVTREMARDGAEKLFERFDVNKDGKIDEADRVAQIGKTFDRIDTNHDGSISREEFMAEGKGMGHEPGMGHGAGGPGMDHGGMGGPGMGGRGMMMRERAMGMGMAIMHEADPQHTGTVTHDGFIAAAMAMFDKADANHDGKISPEERQAAHPMGHHGGMGDDDMHGPMHGKPN